MVKAQTVNTLSRNKFIMLVACILALFSVSAWAHEGENPGKDIPAQTTHSHDAFLGDSCPHLADEADTAGLQHCVATLTNYISDLLRLVMSLSEALAESRNELLRHNQQLQGQVNAQTAQPGS